MVHAYADHSKVKEVFDTDSYTSLEEGVQRMADWAKAHGARQSSTFSNIEIEENLPPSWKV